MSTFTDVMVIDALVDGEQELVVHSARGEMVRLTISEGSKGESRNAEESVLVCLTVDEAYALSNSLFNAACMAEPSYGGEG